MGSPALNTEPGSFERNVLFKKKSGGIIKFEDE